MYEPLECCRCITQPEWKNTILKESKVHMKYSAMLLDLGYLNLIAALG